MLFAAGLGTRLRPHTNDRPKALVEIGGRSLLEINLDRLARAGFTEVVVNAHHYAPLIKTFLAGYQRPGLALFLSDETDKLLDTGGGLRRAQPWLQDAPFLAHNVDILSDLDLGALYAAHCAAGRLATLAVRERPSSRQLLFTPQGELCGWRNNSSGAERLRLPCPEPHAAAFSGIYVLDPRIFRYMPPEGEAFSIIDTFLSIGPHEQLQAYYHNQTAWMDVGKPEALAQAEAWLGGQP
jgi:NDP-sugar pyrophosphorylase family protein